MSGPQGIASPVRTAFAWPRGGVLHRTLYAHAVGVLYWYAAEADRQAAAGILYLLHFAAVQPLKVAFKLVH